MSEALGADSLLDRLAKVLRLTKVGFGSDVGDMIDLLLSRQNLSIMAGTMTIWAGSHLFGVGEIVDVLLPCVGALSIGWSIKIVAEDLYTFTIKTIRGHTDRGLGGRRPWHGRRRNPEFRGDAHARAAACAKRQCPLPLPQ